MPYAELSPTARQLSSLICSLAMLSVACASAYFFKHKKGDAARICLCSSTAFGVHVSRCIEQGRVAGGCEINAAINHFSRSFVLETAIAYFGLYVTSAPLVDSLTIALTDMQTITSRLWVYLTFALTSLLGMSETFRIFLSSQGILLSEGPMGNTSAQFAWLLSDTRLSDSVSAAGLGCILGGATALNCFSSPINFFLFLVHIEIASPSPVAVVEAPVSLPTSTTAAIADSVSSAPSLSFVTLLRKSLTRRFSKECFALSHGLQAAVALTVVATSFLQTSS